MDQLKPDAPLPVDTYTVTLRSGADGIRDPRGNQLDGETDGSYQWPGVSGNGSPGSARVMWPRQQPRPSRSTIDPSSRGT